MDKNKYNRRSIVTLADITFVVSARELE